MIYGAGRVGQDYKKQIYETGYCNIVSFLDANAEQYDNTVVLPEEGLKKFKVDYIVVAVKSEKHASDIKELLLNYISDKCIIHDIKIVRC